MKTRAEIPALLNRRGLTAIGVEVGVRHGVHARKILEQWTGEMLVLVDCWRCTPEAPYTMSVTEAEHADRKAFARRHLAPFAGRIEFCCELSYVAAGRWPDNYFDFVYIDPEHSYRSVCRDLAAFWPKLKTGGLFAGDDYLDGYRAIPSGLPVPLAAGQRELMSDDAFLALPFGVRSAVLEFADQVQREVHETEDDFNWWFFK